MGWNGVHHNSSHPLWQGIGEGSRFYFVHSYYMDPAQSDVVLATTEYGIEFVSAIGAGNVFAVQFHPEKSARDGLQLLKNFAHWDGNI
jgi:glutamine amidotransferase